METWFIVGNLSSEIEFVEEWLFKRFDFEAYNGGVGLIENSDMLIGDSWGISVPAWKVSCD